MVRFFISQVDQWLDTAPQHIRGNKARGREVAAVPLMFYVMGELDLAIDYSDEILNDARFSFFEAKRRVSIQFNRVNFMVEREYHYPSPDKSQREQIKTEAEAAAVALREAGVPGADASAMDLRGLALITFAETMEEVREGIRLCMSAAQYSPVEEQDVSEAYADLNVRLGWRRYFELEVLSVATGGRATA